MKPIRLGIIGCGAIAQIQHLPNLAMLRDQFEVTMVCDRSPALAEYVAKEFHVPDHTSDYANLLESDVEAVILCHTDPKTQVAVEAFEAGKHVFIEKPMCYSLDESDAIITASEKSGKVGQVGYVKIYDPAFELAKREVDTMSNVSFVQINHLHPNNTLHLDQFRIKRFDDIPAAALDEVGKARQAAFHDAIGEVADYVEKAFSVISGSMIHDLYGLRVMIGLPNRIVSTEIWNEGRAITTTFEYGSGARCVATWADLPNLWDFKETLEVYGDDKRVILSYPTGFARGILSEVKVYGLDDDGTTFSKEPAIDWEMAFSRELLHFHECVVGGTASRSSVASARDDISLIINITKSYLARGPIEIA